MRAKLVALTISLAATQPIAAQGITVTQAAEGLIVADCATTQIALTNGAFETNPILGRNPTPARLWTTCAVAGVGLAILPRKIRRPVAFITAVVQVLNVIWNIGRIS